MTKLVSYTFGSTFMLISIVNSLSAVGQNEIAGKYSRTDYPGGYILLSADKSFKFRFRSHNQWDLACGQFEMKNDTLFFTYTSEMSDIACNSERINMSDTTDYFLKMGVDRTCRPIIARFIKDKIMTIKTGDIHEPESVGRRVYSYKREKERK